MMASRMDIPTAFTQHQLVPDVVSSPPSQSLTVIYPDGTQVQGGNELMIKSTQQTPIISCPTEGNTYYTLFMFDPDNNSRETHEYRQFIHYGVINIPGDASAQNLNISAGNLISPYMGCAPNPGTGRHRYVFLLYRQMGVIPTTNIKVLGEASLLGLKSNMEQRQNFNQHAFFAQQSPAMEPTLVAGTFFFAQAQPTA